MAAILEQSGINRLSTKERLELIDEIRGSIAPICQMEIPESHKEELYRRLADADADPAAGRPWNEVRARLRGQS